jgi:hypothetical protein
MLTANACGGTSFSGVDTPAGGSGATSAGMAGESGGPAMSHGGQATDGGKFSGAGDTASGSAGDSSNAGAAGAGAVLDCTELGGHEFSAHCYVDVTTESVAYAEAVASCAKLSSRASRTGQLLVLGSIEEQAFVLLQFLSDFTDVSDAWLGLTCDSTQYPDFTSCYCTNCDDSQRAKKRAAWAWLDGSNTDFGWIGQNPNGEGRCSAFAYNPSISSWGWVDRSCTKTTHQLTGYPAHDYRTICELE